MSPSNLVYTLTRVENPIKANNNSRWPKTRYSPINVFIYIFFFLTFDFCRFCMVLTSDFEGFSIPDFIHYIYFPLLMLEKEPVFHFLIFSGK